MNDINYEGRMKFIEKAREENLVIYVRDWEEVRVDVSVWFTPDELLKKNKEGRYCWKPESFELRTRQQIIEEDLETAHAKVRKAQEEVKSIRKRLGMEP